MSAKISTEDLMKGRYKVIADWPESEYYVGEVLTGHAGKWYNETMSFYADESYFTKYPHLFRKLEWWQDRKIEDMPEYVKCLGFVRKFKKWHHQENGMVQLYDYPGEIGYEDDISKEVRERGYEIYVITDCLPSTETEYLNQQT